MSNPVSELIENTMKSIKDMVNVDSVIGDPIKVEEGTVVIPVAKVSYGFCGGGNDRITSEKNNADSFTGGAGGGATVKTEAFLVITNGNVRLIPVSGNVSSVDKLVDLVPGIVDKISGIFSKNNGETTYNDN